MQIRQDYNIKAYTVRSCQPRLVELFEPMLSFPADGGAPVAKIVEQTSNFLIYENKLSENWLPDNNLSNIINSLDDFLEKKPDILILGTGTTQVFPDPSLMVALNSRGIGLEVMDSCAACRTYNILVSDGRDVAAAILLD